MVVASQNPVCCKQSAPRYERLASRVAAVQQAENAKRAVLGLRILIGEGGERVFASTDRSLLNCSFNSHLLRPSRSPQPTPWRDGVALRPGVDSSQKARIG